MKIYSHRIQNKINKLRGVPVETDLREYQRCAGMMNTIPLAGESDHALKRRSAELQSRATTGAALDDLMTEAFALVRETAHRVLDMRPFDVQVEAAAALHKGTLVEMQTGEGKTLAAILPAYLNALVHQGFHILTFNDYLARRDASWMGPVFTFLGLRVGCIQEGMSNAERKQAYACDITYATAKEAGFDFLRDNLCYHPDEQVHRSFHCAIVDEADSIMIDEARIPLVIAGVTDQDRICGREMAAVAKCLKLGEDVETDDGRRNINLTDSGLQRAEALLECRNLHAQESYNLLVRLNQALHAEHLLRRDVDYIVRGGRIEIVDEFTGRVVENRHWPDGLQAAVEAKEGLAVQSAGSILGSITLQHYLKQYPKLSGMTATACSAAHEFMRFYGLKVVVIPPNLPCIRRDHQDRIFTHQDAKVQALSAEIKRVHSTRRPVLVGTSSVEESETLAARLMKTGIPVEVLNAKNDEHEAAIIARAGTPGTVTISTNMAGRGTDIKLGGNHEQEREQVKAMGGLYVIGTNRHESVRIDNQLRGRAGRQGDPGESRFFVSLEDDLFVRFGLNKRLPAALRNQRRGEPISIPLVRREVTHGQRRIEGQNFDIRRSLWDYSSLTEKQRALIAALRRSVLWEHRRLISDDKSQSEALKRWEAELGRDAALDLACRITLAAIDQCWIRHLALIADIRESIHLVKVSGRPPLGEFQKIATKAFLDLESEIERALMDKFKQLGRLSGRIVLARSELKGPSSTWTYLVNDDQFGAWMELLQGSNIGFAAGAAAWYGFLFIGWGIIRKLKERHRDNGHLRF